MLFFSPPIALRLLLALLALAFSCPPPAFLVPVPAAPRLPLLYAESLEDFVGLVWDFIVSLLGIRKKRCLGARAHRASGPCSFAGPRGPWRHLLLLLREEERLLPELLRLPDDEERLPPFALARSLCARLFWVLAFPPLLAACARLIFPEEDLEEDGEEELRDAIACSLVGWMKGRCSPASAFCQSRQT